MKLKSICSKPFVYQSIFIRKKKDANLVIDYEIPSWIVVDKVGLSILKYCDGTKSIDRIYNKVYKLYGKEFNIYKSDIYSFIAYLSQKKLLYQNKMIRKKFVEKIDGLSIKPLPAKNLLFSITNKCNLKCRHCYLSKFHERIDLLDIYKVKRVILDFVRLQGEKFENKSLIITGGEPLLRNDLFEILEYCSNLKLNTKICSNATLIDKNTVHKLRKYKVEFFISLDGSDRTTNDKIRGTGSFEAALNGIHNLIKEKLNDKIWLSFTLMKTNINNIGDFIDMADDLKIKGVILNYFLPMEEGCNIWNSEHVSTNEIINMYNFIETKLNKTKRGVEIYTPYLKEITLSSVQRRNCAIGRTLRIDFNGDVYPCPSLIGKKEFCLGNVQKLPLSVIVNGKNMKSVIYLSYKRIKKLFKEKKCPWVYYCKGGCMAMSISIYNNLWKCSPICRIIKNYIYYLIQKESGIDFS